MKKLKFLLTLLAAILLMVVILSLLSVQRDNRAAEPAMRLLQSEAPRGDGEGSDALRLLPYDIPDATERRQIMAQLGNHMPADDKLPESLRHRKLISDGEDQTLSCAPKFQEWKIVAGCLQNVRDHADTYRAVVAQHAKLFANADRVSQYRNLDVRILDIVTDAFPKYQYLFYQTTPAAVDWLDGKSEAAFARICRNIRTGKTLQQSRGGLISTMVGAAMVRQNTKLAADMLAEQPQWAGKLPAHCADAFAPSADHAENFCRAMQFEYHYITDNIAHHPSQLREEMPAWLVPVLFSAEHSKTLAARQLARPVAAIRQLLLPAQFGGLHTYLYRKCRFRFLCPPPARHAHAAARFSGRPRLIPAARTPACRRITRNPCATQQPITPTELRPRKQSHHVFRIRRLPVGGMAHTDCAAAKTTGGNGW